MFSYLSPIPVITLNSHQFHPNPISTPQKKKTKCHSKAPNNRKPNPSSPKIPM